MNYQQIKECLRAKYPELAITIEFTLDPSCQWDGEPKDEPESDAYFACVRASVINNGNLICGEDYLGGLYPEENGYDAYADEQPDEVYELDGYFPQMVEQALFNLNYLTGRSYEL